MISQHLRSFSMSCAKRSFWAIGLGIAALTALPGCVATAQGELIAEYPEEEYVEYVPPRIEYYPRTYYRGSPAYLVEGRWYYRSHDRWSVFRQEPRELREYRVRQAPAYLGPSQRYYGRSQERIIAERRGQDAQIYQQRIEEQRARERRDDAHREAERRALDDRRRARFEQQRSLEQRRDEQRRDEHRRDAQRADEHRRYEGQRAAERRADDQRRGAEPQDRATRKRDRSRGDQSDSRDERDRRRYRQD